MAVSSWLVTGGAGYIGAHVARAFKGVGITPVVVGDLSKIRSALRSAVIFDGRNIFDPQVVEAAGLAYYGIGRGRSVAKAGLAISPLILNIASPANQYRTR